MKSISLLAMIAAVALPSMAQTPRPLNELTEELKQIEFLIGDWTAEGARFVPDAEKESWTGTTRGRWALRGRHLRLDSTVTTKAGTTESSAMLSWDQSRERYHAILFSSTEATPRFVVGTLEGNKLSLHGSRSGESESRLTMTFEKASDEQFTLNVEMVSEESTTRIAEGKYVKRR